MTSNQLNRPKPHYIYWQHIEPVLKYAHVFHDEKTNDFKATKDVSNIHIHRLAILSPEGRLHIEPPYALRRDASRRENA
jgi:hypothetical protein